MRDFNASKLFGGLMIAAIVGVAVMTVGHMARLVASPPPGAGEPAPDFALAALAGGDVRLSDQAGKVRLLEFWTSSCVGCIGATPKLNRLHARYGSEGLSVISVNMDGDGGQEAQGVVERRSIAYPVLIDPGEVARAYGVYATPTAILIDAEGVIRSIHRGNVTERRLDREIRSLLAAR